MRRSTGSVANSRIRCSISSVRVPMTSTALAAILGCRSSNSPTRAQDQVKIRLFTTAVAVAGYGMRRKTATQPGTSPGSMNRIVREAPLPVPCQIFTRPPATRCRCVGSPP